MFCGVLGGGERGKVDEVGFAEEEIVGCVPYGASCFGTVLFSVLSAGDDDDDGSEATGFSSQVLLL